MKLICTICEDAENPKRLVLFIDEEPASLAAKTSRLLRPDGTYKEVGVYHRAEPDEIMGVFDREEMRRLVEGDIHFLKGGEICDERQ